MGFDVNIFLVFLVGALGWSYKDLLTKKKLEGYPNDRKNMIFYNNESNPI